MIRVFQADGLFQPIDVAKRFLRDRGFSIGQMQSYAPIGLLLGTYAIQKWRNLSRTDRDRLHGEIRTVGTGRMAADPVAVEIYDHCAEALAAFALPDPPPAPMSAMALLHATYDGPIPAGALEKARKA